MTQANFLQGAKRWSECGHCHPSKFTASPRCNCQCHLNEADLIKYKQDIFNYTRQIMTDKTQLKKDFQKLTETKWQRGEVIERMLHNDDLDTVFDFFWDAIEQTKTFNKDLSIGVIEELLSKQYGTSTHGSCCTCTRCKNGYDDCTCSQIAILTDALTNLKQAYER